MRQRVRLAVGVVMASTTFLGITAIGVIKLHHHESRPASSAAADPVEVLNKVNSKLAALPDVIPRPDQFVYVQMHTSGSSQLSQFWLSVDGTHDGLMIRPDLAAMAGGSGRIPMPGCRNGERPIVRGDKVLSTQERCVPTVAFDPSLPTDATSMAALLASTGPDASKDPTELANARGKYILGTLEFMYLTRAQRIALLTAAKNLSGISVQANAADSAGRAGLGLTWSSSGTSEQNTLVVDPDTGQYMGTTQGDSVVAMAVVSAVGATS